MIAASAFLFATGFDCFTIVFPFAGIAFAWVLDLPGAETDVPFVAVDLPLAGADLAGATLAELRPLVADGFVVAALLAGVAFFGAAFVADFFEVTLPLTVAGFEGADFAADFVFLGTAFTGVLDFEGVGLDPVLALATGALPFATVALATTLVLADWPLREPAFSNSFTGPFDLEALPFVRAAAPFFACAAAFLVTTTAFFTRVGAFLADDFASFFPDALAGFFLMSAFFAISHCFYFSTDTRAIKPSSSSTSTLFSD